MKRYSTNFILVLMAYSLPIINSQDLKKEYRERKFVLELLAGGITGYSELLTGAPLNYAQNSIYQNIPLSKNPRIWYQGSMASGLTTGLTTAIAASIKEELAHVIHGDSDANIAQSLMCTTMAGFVSGVISAPVASLVMHKQKYQESYKQTLIKAPLTKSIFADGMREGGFAPLLFAIYPLIKKECKAKINNELLAAIAASIIAGPITSALTHPAATIGGIVRSATMGNQQYIGIKNEYDALRYLYHNGGIWKGYAPRTCRIIIALPVMGYMYQTTLCALKTF